MKWGRAIIPVGTVQERLVALEDTLARLSTEIHAAEERRLMHVSLMDRRADETAERLAALMGRVEAIEELLADRQRTDSLIDEEQLAKALIPLKLEIAATVRQAAVDEEQAQRAYGELTVQMERIRQEIVGERFDPAR